MTESDMEWRPIETAPKGELILVADGSTLAPATFCFDLWYFWEGGLQLDDNLEQSGIMNNWIKGFGPTHWMPLPAPPSAKIKR